MSADTRKHYEDHGYAIVKSVASHDVAKHLVAMIRQDMTARPDIMRQLLKTPAITKKPTFEFYSYHYPAVLGFHWGLTSRIEELTGNKLTPTYAYFRIYQKGDRCIVHSDRQSCEHSFSMALHYSDDIVWPFEIGEMRYDYDAASAVKAADDFDGEHNRRLGLEPGDAVLYQGCNYRHGRTTPNPNRWSAHLFLHWVDVNGPFKEWAFDKHAFPAMGDFQFPGQDGA